VVENAREHPIFSQLGVTQAVNIGSYIGVPIRYADGTIVGTLCGLDPDPRKFEPIEIHFLQVLARSVAALLERRAGVAGRGHPIDRKALQAAQLNLQNVIEQTRSQLEHRQTGTALLIDTTIRLRQPIAGVLRKNNYRPVEFFKLPTLETLQAEIERHKATLLVLVESENQEQDIELIKELRRNVRYLNLPVLYLTHQRINQINAYAAGASRCYLYTADIDPFLRDLYTVVA
jgi:GAF domain-containing protein